MREWTEPTGEDSGLVAALRPKLLLEADAELDRRFWERLEREAGARPLPGGEPTPGWAWLPELSALRPARVLPALAVAAGAIVLASWWLRHQEALHRLQDSWVADRIVAKAEVLANLELLAEFDELPVSDREWSVLLRRKVGR
jgi:hypothetical protein